MRHKYSWLLLILVSTVVICSAAEWDLRGGVFIAHYVPELAYTSDPPTEGWCAAYDAYAIQSAVDQVNRIDIPSDVLSVSWYVLAAWTEDKEFCGVEFGFGDYDERIFQFMEYEACYPPAGGLEIPHPAWPGPETGTVFTCTGEPWVGNYLPVYWFGGYAYSAHAPELITIDVNTNYAYPYLYHVGFANCLNPPELYDPACLGALGFNMDGLACIPEPPIPIAACCIGTECELLPEEECLALGGEWIEEITYCLPLTCEWWVCCHGYQYEECDILRVGVCELLGGEWHPEFSSCTPNPCGLPYACCLEGGECVMLTWGVCMEAGGYWLEGEVCEPNPCFPVAVCCIEEVCEILPWGECYAIGGIWHEEWTSCDPNPCISTPIGEASWGRIKALYR